MQDGQGGAEGPVTSEGVGEDGPRQNGKPSDSETSPPGPKKIPGPGSVMSNKSASAMVKKERKALSRKLEKVRVIDERKKEDPVELEEYKGRVGKLMLLERKWGELQWKGRYVTQEDGTTKWDPEMVIVIKNDKGKFSKFRPIVLKVIEHSLELGMPLDMALGNAAVKREDYERWLENDNDKGALPFRGLRARMYNAWRRGVTRWYSQLLEKGSKSPDTIMKILSNLDDKLFRAGPAGSGIKGGMSESLKILFEDAPERDDKDIPGPDKSDDVPDPGTGTQPGPEVEPVPGPDDLDGSSEPEKKTLKDTPEDVANSEDNED